MNLFKSNQNSSQLINKSSQFAPRIITFVKNEKTKPDFVEELRVNSDFKRRSW